MPERRFLTDNKRCSVEKRKRSTKRKRSRTRKLIKKHRAPVTVKTSFVRDSSNSASSSRKLTAFEAFMQDVVEMGVRGIRQEFVSDVREYVPSGSTRDGDSDANSDKNRYDNIPLLDATRIKLRGSCGDYIHASMVHVENGVDFVCTQGPLENTVEQFWIMVVQQTSRVILQLCMTVEDGKEKSCEYFAPTTDETKTYGSVKVRTLEKLPKIAALKKVSRTKLSVSYDNTTTEIIHVQYAGWPDHFVPDSATVCSELRTLVLKLHGGRPIVVHCSAGIGRTGTFVAVEMVLQKLKMKETPDVRDVVKNLREQRYGCVQNDRQYLFIYRMVVESLLLEGRLNKDQRMIDFFNEYDELIDRKRAEAVKKK